MAIAETEVHIILEGSITKIQNWIKSEGLVRFGAATAFVSYQSYPSANGLVISFEPLIHRYAELVQQIRPTDSDSSTSLLHMQIATAAGSSWLGASESLTNDVAIGLTATFRDLLRGMTTADPTRGDYDILTLSPGRQMKHVAIAGKALAYLASAALDRYMTEVGEGQYQYKLERIRSLLGLRPAELARLLNVTREGLRQWQSGTRIAAERKPDIDQLSQLTAWFAQHILPEALPSFVRRRIPALNNQTPLEWIASRRYDEIKGIFERGFDVATTA